MIKIFLLAVFLISKLILLNTHVLAQSQIELNKRWGFITPCLTSKADVEKRFGNSITEDKTHPSQTYDVQNERLTVIYKKSKEVKEGCGNNLPADTVLRFFTFPNEDIKLSDLKIDLTEYEKDVSRSPREIWYLNENGGILIVTKILEQKNNTKTEMVKAIEFRPKSNGFASQIPNNYYRPTETVTFYNPSKSKAENLDYMRQVFDNFVLALKSQNIEKQQWRGYAIVYFDKQLSLKDYRSYLNRVKKSVYGRHNLSPRTLAVIEGGLKDKSEVELYLLGKNEKAPVPKPKGPNSKSTRNM